MGKGDEDEEILCMFSSFFLISLNYILQILLLSENVFILNYLEVFFFFFLHLLLFEAYSYFIT